MAPDRTWRLVARDELRWRSWDGETVVYDDRSGGTHRLGLAASCAFLALASAGELSETALGDALRDLAGEAGIDLDAIVRPTIDDLARLDLIEQAAR